MKELPSRWVTPRCLLVEAGEEGLAEYTQVYEENAAVLALLASYEPASWARLLAEAQALPPEGHVEHLHSYLVYDRSGSRLLGLLSVYCGHPTPDSLKLNDLFVRPAVQRQGYGCELVAGLERAAARLGARWVYLDVGLKNWPSLRFWISCGYTQIVRMFGDPQHGSQSFANLELCKELPSAI